MQKKDGRKKGEERKPALKEALDVTRLIFGEKEPQDEESLNEPGMGPFFKRPIKNMEEAKKQEELQILDSLEYPGGKRVH